MALIDALNAKDGTMVKKDSIFYLTTAELFRMSLVILLKRALTELKVHPSIPKKVTLNEYIEISKFYSTPKSQVFINGILDKAIPLIEERGELKKSGRGLIN